MTKKIIFTITTLWILLTRSYDAYCISQLTPDLSKESNPLLFIHCSAQQHITGKTDFKRIETFTTYYQKDFDTGEQYTGKLRTVSDFNEWGKLNQKQTIFAKRIFDKEKSTHQKNKYVYVNDTITTTNTYDEKQRLIKSERKEGQNIYKNVYVYTSNLVRNEYLYGNNVLVTHITFGLNKNGDTISYKNMQYFNGKAAFLVHNVSYDYDKKNRKIRTTAFEVNSEETKPISKINYMMQYYYNEKGLLEKEEHIGYPSKTIYKTISYKFDSLGRKINRKETNKQEEGDNTSEIRYKYEPNITYTYYFNDAVDEKYDAYESKTTDNKGNITEIYNWDNTHETKDVMQYDEHNRLVKRIFYENGEMTIETTNTYY